MKTFLNVLYRRILYKIPLKFLLVLLAILAVFVASVKADLISYDPDGIIRLNFTISAGESTSSSTTFGDILCMQERNNGNCNSITITNNGNSITGNPYYKSSSNDGLDVFCVKGINGAFNIVNNTNSSCNLGMFRISSQNFKTTSLECQTEYNLIPVSSVDQNYCTTNNLCPTCQVCPSGSGSISTLYINDILHVGAPFIYLDIPEEIGWDYGYTQGGTNMLIDVEGYNVDYEAVQNVIDQQNYKPTQEDFQNLILILGPYGKIIIFFVFLFILWAWIKKPFKFKL